METQLVRLDAPYNLICNNRAQFGLHIATLMVVKERQGEDTFYVQGYPVVAEKYGLGGQTWFNDDLQHCKVIAIQGESVTLRVIKQIMEFASWGEDHLDVLAMRLMTTLSLYGVTVYLSNEECGAIMVELCFSGVPNARLAVYSATDSPFYFYACFDPDVENRTYPIKISQSQAIDDILDIRQAYLIPLRIVNGTKGVTDITFYTNQPKYKYFVDELNKKAHANGK